MFKIGERIFRIRLALPVSALSDLKCFSNSSSSGSNQQSDIRSHEHSKYMKKLLNKGGKAKKKWYHAHLNQPADNPNLGQSGPKKQASPQNRIRAVQLSHVLFDRISHIINTGELSEEILDKQVLITRVKMLQNFNEIHVYWDSNRSDAASIEVLLDSHAGKLRDMLISYHVLGRIPPINFVQDKKWGNLTLLDQLLEVADYGPDYTPSSNRHYLHGATGQGTGTTPSRWTLGPLDSINSAEKVSDLSAPIDDIDVLEGQSLDSNFASSVTGLNFRSDLYSLPHDVLMKRVVAFRMKTRAPVDDTCLPGEDKGAFQKNLLTATKSKLKLKTMSDSQKYKQQRLEEELGKYRDMVAEENSERLAQKLEPDMYEDEYDSEDDNKK